MAGNVLFLIEAGKALELVKKHIEASISVNKQRAELATELGVSNGQMSFLDGTLQGVIFKSDVHPDFTKPKRNGLSYPKKGTEWERRFKAQVGFEYPARVISEAFGIPLCLSYKSENGSGSGAIGDPLQECGFLWLSKDGPYAMWAPDVPAYVAEREANGLIVNEPAKSFQFNIEGCRQIDQEDWDLLVAQRNVEEKRKAKGLKP